MTIDEKQNTVKRSNLYNKLYNIINQIPRKQVNCDAPCPHSCATEIEQLIHEALKKQREVFMLEHDKWFNNLKDNRDFAEIIENLPEPELGE